MENFISSYWPILVAVAISAYLAIKYFCIKSRESSETREKHSTDLTVENVAALEVKPVYMVDVTHRDKRIAEKEFKKYFEPLEALINEHLHRELIITDYVEHGVLMAKSDGNITANLARYYNDYLGTILEKIEKTGISYKRVLFFPISQPIKEYQPDEIEKPLEYILSRTYEPTVRHIQDMVNGGINNFELYVVQDAPRSYSSMIIDKSILIREFDLWENRQCRPDILDIRFANSSPEEKAMIEYEHSVVTSRMSKQERINLVEAKSIINKIPVRR